MFLNYKTIINTIINSINRYNMALSKCELKIALNYIQYTLYIYILNYLVSV